MASISELSWMAGTWRGSLPPRQVEENWGEGAFGAMEARVRITDDNGLTTIELIMIREGGDKGLELLLRQFDPDLNLTNSQHMQLAELKADEVAFVAPEGDRIAGLRYSLRQQNNMQVQVSLGPDLVVTADLYRPEG